MIHVNGQRAAASWASSCLKPTPNYWHVITAGTGATARKVLYPANDANILSINVHHNDLLLAYNRSDQTSPVKSSVQDKLRAGHS
jgi:hypothetical protein